MCPLTSFGSEYSLSLAGGPPARQRWGGGLRGGRAVGTAQLARFQAVFVGPAEREAVALRSGVTA